MIRKLKGQKKLVTLTLPFGSAAFLFFSLNNITKIIQNTILESARKSGNNGCGSGSSQIRICLLQICGSGSSQIHLSTPDPEGSTKTVLNYQFFFIKNIFQDQPRRAGAAGRLRSKPDIYRLCVNLEPWQNLVSLSYE